MSTVSKDKFIRSLSRVFSRDIVRQSVANRAAALAENPELLEQAHTAYLAAENEAADAAENEAIDNGDVNFDRDTFGAEYRAAWNPDTAPIPMVAPTVNRDAILGEVAQQLAMSVDDVAKRYGQVKADPRCPRLPALKRGRKVDDSAIDTAHATTLAEFAAAGLVAVLDDDGAIIGARPA